MIFHIMKDGSRRDSIDGYVVAYEQKKDLYKRLIKKELSPDGYKDTSRTIYKKQISDQQT